MSGSERIGILGGTFNPPHLGHLHAARAAREALGFDRLLFIPDNIPPHKALPPGTPAAEERLAMLRIAARSLPGAEVSDIELRLPAPSYTARTATLLSELYPGARLWWIVGADMLLTVQNWYEPATIFAHCRLAALAREEDDIDALRAHAQWLRQKWGAGVDLIAATPLPLSSTRIRERLTRGETAEGLPPGVAEYIREKGLYRHGGA